MKPAPCKTRLAESLLWHPFCSYRKCQDKAFAEIRGEVCRTNSRVNFAVDFLLWMFLGPFCLEKQEEKIHPKKEHYVWFCIAFGTVLLNDADG